MKLLSLFLKISFFLSDIFIGEMLFLRQRKKRKKKEKKGKKAPLPTFQRETAKKRAKKVKNVSQFERWSDDSHAIERTRDVENTRQENSKVNPFARCIERDRE